MMKQLLTLSFSILILAGYKAQTYLSKNVDLISVVNPNKGPLPPQVGNRYSGCWGWYDAAKMREYAISGASNGTYFIDITDPANPVVCDSVQGTNSTWREMKTYGHYCYIVSDVVKPNNFQIVDLQYLPDSVHVIHNSRSLFELGHTIWIDQDKMYIGLTTFSNNAFSPMTVWSLATPTAPVLLRDLKQDAPHINDVHDMYVRNDTVYASAGWQGIQVFKLESDHSLNFLGSYQGYNKAGYNHSSFLTRDGKYLLFADEVPENIPLNFVDVSSIENIQPVHQWLPAAGTTPHNPYIVDDYAVVSCYQDGLYIYNLTKTPEVHEVGYFDTYPQGGVNTGVYTQGVYSGNWGAYIWLPSKRIIASDMQNGIFILDPSKAYSSVAANKVGLNSASKDITLQVFPNPAYNVLNIRLSETQKVQISISDISGRKVMDQTSEGTEISLNTTDLQTGVYFVNISSDYFNTTKKINISTH